MSAVMKREGAVLSRLGWRVYVIGRYFELYAYTIVGCRGEAEALETVRSILHVAPLKLRAKVVSVSEEDLLPPPMSTMNQS
jgi:hypothetical protein